MTRQNVEILCFRGLTQSRLITFNRFMNQKVVETVWNQVIRTITPQISGSSLYYKLGLMHHPPPLSTMYTDLSVIIPGHQLDLSHGEDGGHDGNKFEPVLSPPLITTSTYRCLQTDNTQRSSIRSHNTNSSELVNPHSIHISFILHLFSLSDNSATQYKEYVPSYPLYF